MLCNGCSCENDRQLQAQQQRNNKGRHLAKQAGQLLPQSVWGKAWGIKRAIGRTAAAVGLAAMQAAHLAGPTMGNGRYPKPSPPSRCTYHDANRWNNGVLLVDEAARQAALERLERRSRNAQGLTRTAAVRSYHSVG